MIADSKNSFKGKIVACESNNKVSIVVKLLYEFISLYLVN